MKINTFIWTLEHFLVVKDDLIRAVLRLRPQKPRSVSQQAWHDKNPSLYKGRVHQASLYRPRWRLHMREIFSNRSKTTDSWQQKSNVWTEAGKFGKFVHLIQNYYFPTQYNRWIPDIVRTLIKSSNFRADFNHYLFKWITV